VKVLVLFDTAIIKAWLVGEDISTVDQHITNGYKELTVGYASGTVKAVNIEVPTNELYRPDLYEANDGMIRRKS
jgi:hypothetical protein